MIIISDFEEIDKAEDLLRDEKVFKLNEGNVEFKDYFIVKGSKNRKYLVVLPNFCTCHHFHINCIREKGKICKHIRACSMITEEISSIQMDDWKNLLIHD